jgi:hypothetical protein
MTAQMSLLTGCRHLLKSWEAKCAGWSYSLVPASATKVVLALAEHCPLRCWSISTIRLSERRCFDEAEGTMRAPYKAAIRTTIAALNVNFLL